MLYAIKPYLIQLDTCSKISQFQVPIPVQKHIVWFDVTVNKAHTVDSVQSQADLSHVKLCPSLADIVLSHQVHKVTT